MDAFMREALNAYGHDLLRKAEKMEACDRIPSKPAT